MDDENIPRFSGVVGKVLRSSFSWRTLATGLALGFVLFVMLFVLGIAGAGSLGPFAVEMVMAIAFARFALNGLHGEWDGTIFSSAGGSAPKVVSVAARYLFASFAWLVPLFFLGLNAMPSPQAFGPQGTGFGSGSLLALTGYLFLSTFTPPLFLIAAVSAADFSQFLSRDHWRRLFAGRSADLFMVYAAYTGALGMAILLALPLIVGAASMAWQLGLVAGMIVGSFLFGLMVSLLGRLCGFYSFEGPTAEPAMDEAPGALAEAASPNFTTTAGAPNPLTGGPPVLTEAREILSQAQRKFQSDPTAGIALLEETNQSFAPHAQVLHGLCMMTHQAGETSKTIDFARTAIPLCIERGTTQLAAEIFKTVWAARATLEIRPEHLMKIAAVYARSKELARAANTYALVLQEEPGEVRAIKGIMQVAEKLAKNGEQATEAAKLYTYLLKVAPDSPLTEYIQSGLETARTNAQTQI